MNILILTSNYKADDLPPEITPVVHYFARLWAANGHRVIIIHNQTIFPEYQYLALNIFSKVLSNKVGYVFATQKYEERSYEIEGVKVYRFNMVKKYPHGNFLEISYIKQIEKIKAVVSLEKFEPDIIIGHWLTPQLKLLSELKKIYKKPTCLVVHEGLPIIERDYPRVWKEYLNSIDFLGYRSKTIREYFTFRYGVAHMPYFMCYSGVPDKFIPKEYCKNFSMFLKRYTFTGTLIKRKHPEEILRALLHKEDWILTYIGEGYLKDNLISLTAELGIDKRVCFKGRIGREEVYNVLKETDVFVMISEGETFGLVYLEAMACGCITIASRGEGMDGIIEDGVNGFLCKPGDVQELQEIIEKIDALDQKQLYSISYQAYLTARRLTDIKVAENYLNELNNIKKIIEIDA